MEPAGKAPSFLADESPAALAAALRGFLVEAVPPTLYEANPGWGRQTPAPAGLKWKGKRLAGHPEIKKKLRNHGTWRQIRVRPVNLAETLVVDLCDVRDQEAGRMTFTVFLSFEAQVTLVQEKWEWGLRVYSGSARARLRVKLALDCEVTTRLEPKGWLLPDAVFRLRIVRSDLRYNNLVFEHFAGFGGTAARVIGDSVLATLKRVKPSLEPRLLDKANAAIVKAGDSKEIRVSLGKLFKRKTKGK
jgi:hypothetical protein